MVDVGPGRRGLVSCLALMLSILLLCGIVALFGERAALPGLMVWLVVAVVLVYLMASGLRRGGVPLGTPPGERVNGSQAQPALGPTGEPVSVRHPFQDWLLDRMIARNLTSMQLALELGVRDDVVEGWVQGRSLPSPIDCARLAAFFGVPERDVLRLAEWSK